MERKENWLIRHGPDKAELLVYLRDFFVYGNDQALDNLINRIIYQRSKLTDKDIQIIIQGVIEEINMNNSVKSEINTKRVLEMLEKIAELEK